MKIIEKFSGEKEELLKTILGVLLIIVALSTLFTFYSYYKIDKSSAQSFIPGPYQQQWQKAMAWVRENTPENAVFAHWWDYGYWVQSIGKRATILDGGNAIVYWNHLMGRHVLTSPNERDSLEFLYTHNGTHLLIDSTEIGKYTAFSSIGADENYDRFSWISTMALDESQTVETNNETIFVYSGGTVVDDDIVWEENGTKILFPKRNAAVGAIILRKGQEFKQPEAIFVYNGKQYTIPLRYAYINENLKDFGSGLEAGIFVFPLMKQGQNGQIEINDLGALLYLSERTINSRVAQLYLFDQPSNYFELAHTESSYIIENLRSNGYDAGEFIEFRGFNGPIKIWEVTYPSDIKANPEYLKTVYPNKEIEFSVKGEYS